MSLKYLLPALQSRPGSVGMPDRDFEKLLLDVQVGRTNSRSQEEFMESLERIINELKAHAVEAEPFLKPVPKKLAPDYDQYISKPMDLGTLLKNVKNRMYKSKKSFARDLNLIWANCLTYNSVEVSVFCSEASSFDLITCVDPQGHPLRQQALFMKRLADHHLSYLADRASEAPAPPTFLTAQLASGSLSRQGRSASVMEQPLNGTLSSGNANGQSDAGAGRDVTMADPDDVIVVDDKPAGAPYIPLPNDIFDSPAIIRTQESMQAYQSLLETDVRVDTAGQSDKDSALIPSWYPQQPRSSRGGSRSRQTSPNALETVTENLRVDNRLGAWWGELNQPQWIGSGFPISVLDSGKESAIEPTGRRSKRHTKKTTRKLKPAPLRDPDVEGGFLQDAVARNIENLSRIRVEAHRLSLHVSALSDENAPPPILPEINLEDDFKAEELLARRKLPKDRSDEVTESVAGQQLRYFVGAMLGQAGFEGMCEQSPYATCDVTHLSSTLSQEMVHLAIRENGNFTPEILSTHVTDDIFKSNQKVEDTLNKIRQAMAAQPELEIMDDDIDDKDMLFGIPGMEDLGDFLGIPGMPAIPRKLLRPPPGISESDKAKPDTPVLEYQPPPPFIPLRSSDIPFQIGLLRSFYTERLGDAEEIPEDDFDPNLPPMGAMGQVNVKTVSAATKRKAEAAAATAGSTDANKKKSKFLPPTNRS
ncbi:hypothetical protein QFC22_001951 [Naganishia vaughanmartiniae]|uniref:Uncharacterized protein n=1 Tax=Naganishia vaughanmartiniae TaxID=1424756 RepID=A0ACC2XII3_9TREE|nr:hypothetical protein QFC22_001951 [Naganishia vaughanmartiniae]